MSHTRMTTSAFFYFWSSLPFLYLNLISCIFSVTGNPTEYFDEALSNFDHDYHPNNVKVDKFQSLCLRKIRPSVRSQLIPFYSPADRFGGYSNQHGVHLSVLRCILVRSITLIPLDIFC